MNRPGAGFTSLSFVDSLYGWASLGGWRPYKTTDGGLNWIEQTNMTDFYMSSDVYFANQDTGWIIDADSWSVLDKTTDGGLTWDTVANISGAYNFNFFPSPSHWIINGSYVYITTDSGNGWNDITNDIPAGFNNFQAPNDLVGYAAGPGGFILKYNDTTFTPVELTSFSGDLLNNMVLLTWATISETNNKGYEVHRSDAVDQNSVWQKIAFVEGNGTTTHPHEYSFSDNSVEPGKYYYRLKQIDFSGKFKYSKEIEVEVTSPKNFSLMQNYPNPFNPETNISFTIPEETNVSIKLYDITGREIKILVNEKKQPGYYAIKLKGGDLSSGVYFYRLTTSSGFTSVKKLILLK